MDVPRAGARLQPSASHDGRDAVFSYSMESLNSTKAGVYDSFAAVLKALAHGRRLELVELLAQGEHSVDALARMTGVGVSTVSANLQTLKQAGLVETRRDGTTIHYRLAGDDVAELYVAAKRVGLRRSAALRSSVDSYLGAAATAPRAAPADVTEDAAILDVRPAIEYEAGHLPGAVSIPLADLATRWTELPAGRRVVVYCRGEFCRMAREAADWLCANGVDAAAMEEGVVEWRASGRVQLDAIA
jgi:rhodanese-related sulfurtransferase/DNA-binding transcriptional ArsR family regulator